MSLHTCTYTHTHVCRCSRAQACEYTHTPLYQCLSKIVYGSHETNVKRFSMAPECG